GRLKINASGWPMRSMAYSYRLEPTRLPNGQFGPVLGVISGGIELEPFPHTRPPAGNVNFTYLRALPCSPLWPGFAINTLCYAALGWLLFAAPFALRRRRRIKRGL